MTDNFHDDEDRAGATVLWLPQTIELLQQFRTFNPDVTANQIITFLLVANKPGINNKAILSALGLSDGGQSRTISALSKHGDKRAAGRQGKPGWDVIDSIEDEADRRYKVNTLNKRGKILLDRLNRIMTGNQGTAK